uniref:Uncharacterized protein n=1 Tax=Malurus cyaneus samueli TaxID=2593467 RepID=A0A8C5TQE3_9PASS
MAVNTPERLREIPSPSEKDWQKDDEEDFFLLDPDRERDALPQPFRMIRKLLMQVFESAMEIIERREMLRELGTLIFSLSWQVTGRANCLALSGKYIFVGLSMGLTAFSKGNLKDVCAWDAAKTEICAIHASDLGNECHVLLAPVFLWQADISQRSACVEVVLSRRGDYAGILLQGKCRDCCVWRFLCSQRGGSSNVFEICKCSGYLGLCYNHAKSLLQLTELPLPLPVPSSVWIRTDPKSELFGTGQCSSQLPGGSVKAHFPLQNYQTQFFLWFAMAHFYTGKM